MNSDKNDFDQIFSAPPDDVKVNLRSYLEENAGQVCECDDRLPHEIESARKSDPEETLDDIKARLVETVNRLAPQTLEEIEVYCREVCSHRDGCLACHYHWKAGVLHLEADLEKARAENERLDNIISDIGDAVSVEVPDEELAGVIRTRIDEWIKFKAAEMKEKAPEGCDPRDK